MAIELKSPHEDEAFKLAVGKKKMPEKIEELE